MDCKLTKNERIEIILMNAKDGASQWSVANDFNIKYPNRAPISHANVGKLFNLFQETGSIHDQQCSSHPKSPTMAHTFDRLPVDGDYISQDETEAVHHRLLPKKESTENLKRKRSLESKIPNNFFIDNKLCKSEKNSMYDAIEDDPPKLQTLNVNGVCGEIKDEQVTNKDEQCDEIPKIEKFLDESHKYGTLDEHDSQSAHFRDNYQELKNSDDEKIEEFRSKNSSMELDPLKFIECCLLDTNNDETDDQSSEVPKISKFHDDSLESGSLDEHSLPSTSHKESLINDCPKLEKEHLFIKEDLIEDVSLNANIEGIEELTSDSSSMGIGPLKFIECCLLDASIDDDPLPAIEWLKNKGLIRQTMECEGCNKNMNWTKRSRVKDRFEWKCQNKLCPKYKSMCSIRKGSFFYQSHIGLPKWMRIIYLWSVDECMKNACLQIGIGRSSMVDFYSFLREVCEKYFSENPVELGGPGIIVVADELCFSDKAKYHRDRDTSFPTWVFGLVDTSVNPAVAYMEVVDKRDPATLFPIIEKVVKPGSIVHSKEWRTYASISALGFNNGTVNDSINFVNKQTDVHSQITDMYWAKQRSKIKNMRGCKKELLNSYLQEMMWRDRFGSNSFINICDHIAIQSQAIDIFLRS